MSSSASSNEKRKEFVQVLALVVEGCNALDVHFEMTHSAQPLRCCQLLVVLVVSSLLFGVLFAFQDAP